MLLFVASSVHCENQAEITVILAVQFHSIITCALFNGSREVGCTVFTVQLMVLCSVT